MSLPSLGSLKKVDVRHIWQTEAQHFTPWLAQNLDIWAETLDMEPKFNIVSKPNDWSRSVGQTARQIETGTLTDIKAARLEFWTQLAEKLKENFHIRRQKPMPQHWSVFRIGRSGFHMSGLHNTRDKCIGVELYINHQNAKDFYNQLYAQKNDIEAEIGHELIWKELPNKSASLVILVPRLVD